MKDSRVRRRLEQVCGVLILQLIINSSIPYILLLLPRSALEGFAGELSREILEMLLYILSYVLPAAFLLKLQGRSLAGAVGLSPTLPERPIRILLCALAVSSVSGAITQGWLELCGRFGINAPRSAPVSCGSTSALMLRFFSMVIVPAAVEEIFYRGVIMTELSEFGGFYAVIISSAAFALSHADTGTLLGAFCVGVIAGIYSQRCGSIWIAVLIHAANNTLAFIFEYISVSSPEAGAGAQYIACALLTVAFCALSPGLLRELYDDDENAVRPVLSGSDGAVSALRNPAAALYMLLCLALAYGGYRIG